MVSINETLRTEAAARLASPEYTNRCDHLFQPDGFRMARRAIRPGSVPTSSRRMSTCGGRSTPRSTRSQRAVQAFLPDHKGQADLPVVSVSWIEAAGFPTG